MHELPLHCDMRIGRAVSIATVGLFVAGTLHAQEARPVQEEVHYLNPEDGTTLTAYLSVPPASGQFPTVVLLSVAGIVPVTEHLTEAGYAVLAPIRRGFVAVEPLLQATYADLGGDLRAALDFLVPIKLTTAPKLELVDFINSTSLVKSKSSV